jgi:hypothetical protein
MLAYVFSHRAAAGVAVADYESALRRFHSALAASRPAGFISSRVYGTDAAYSDWYLIENAAALDGLNAAAVRGARSGPHDEAARMAAEGSGKLMTRVAGSLTVVSGHEVGFSKPPGVSYSELEAMLLPWSRREGVSLWRRMMVLGPPPEFCLITPSEVELPGELSPKARRIRLVYP